MVAKNIIIAIGNQKGGVGKTTSTACIGAALALQGRRVLLIDLDAQQNLTFTLTQNEDPETSIYPDAWNISAIHLQKGKQMLH